MGLPQEKNFCERYGGVVWNLKTQDSNLGCQLYFMCGLGQATYLSGPSEPHLHGKKRQSSNERWYL